MTVTQKWAGAIVAALSLSTLLLGTPAHARGISKVEFAAGTMEIFTIAIVPPQAEMVTRKVGADDSMIAESRLLEEYGLENTVVLLTEKGYRITRITQEMLETDSELQELVRQANTRFEEEYAKLARKPGMLKKDRYSVGEEAQQLADYLDVDAIIFERIYMEAAAGGQMAMALLIGAGSAGGAKFDVTMVDGDDGSVIGYYNWLLGAIGKDAATNKSEQMVARMATKALKKFPKVPIGAVPPAKESDDAELDELESLLGEEEAGDAELEELEMLLEGDEAGMDAVEAMPEEEPVSETEDFSL